MTGITPEEFTRGLEAQIADARAREGGRHSCCYRGPCATHLAEDLTEQGKHASTIHCGSSLAVFPETDGQTLTAAATSEQILLGIRILGLDRRAL